jgi:hypothetical protein
VVGGGDSGIIEVGKGDGGIGDRCSGAGEGRADTNDLGCVDKGVRFAVGAEVRPGGECGGRDETEIGRLGGSGAGGDGTELKWF